MTSVRAISRIVSYCRYHRRGLAFLRFAAGAVLAVILSLPQIATATTVRMVTNLGNIDIQLYDDETPITVANFLRYAGSGRYTADTGFIHRRATVNTSGVSVIQGGGYAWYYDPNYPLRSFVYHIQTDPPIKNEFSPLRPNVRGTIAMAKTADPDSATSEWFINLDNNNSAVLDDINNSGGFTVFGNVVLGTMNTVDIIANLTVQPSDLWISPSLTMYFGELPVITSFNPATDFDLINKLVQVTSIPNVAAAFTPLGTWTIFTSDVDMIFTPGFFGSFDASHSASLLATFTPPTGKTVQLNDGISKFTMTGPIGSAGRIVTLLHGSATTPNGYYAYGKTPDNPTDHWYDFTFDSTTGTGAEFVGNKILLHFVDGQRGDDDLTVNDSITHTGAPVLVTDIPSLNTTNSAGCTIAALPSQSTGNGDWLVVSLFLAFVALARRRSRR